METKILHGSYESLLVIPEGKQAKAMVAAANELLKTPFIGLYRRWKNPSLKHFLRSSIICFSSK